ncbi:hypothetical protein BDV27DRAFT_138805 [Aspergillus caelatus]|uniref:Uncharacterized protein n=2 Tax=Aspergillus subgen. Circumdati TaxID=2720871 RepID=A0A5N6ZJC3_9EURO|nr:uncharacterized protein BDV27DRAFT_138805 [Aspergillus caelatus]KAE8357724.1 hypothetical protein BDV27DRAFT_138805 [Aspergillus caelatus]KAE8412857.1 hypothetical protein BDV36DRAFT_46400 [Aspergillus pseudocaelatus]
MHTSALLLVLSSLGAHAVPLLRPRTNDTLARRDVQYSVVNVGGPPSAETTPVVETVTVASPPQAPVTITITHTPSSSPSSTPTPSSWSAGPLSTGIPSGESPFVARGLNATARRFRRSSSANNTEVNDLAARHNGTVSHLDARSNNTASLVSRSNSTESTLIARSNSTAILTARGNSTESKIAARSNGTASGLGARSNIINSHLTARTNNTASAVIARSNSTEANTISARSNSTNSHVKARSLNITDRAVLYLRDALNSTRVHDSNAVAKRSSNGTSLEA